jgi:hypothetical protein
VVARIVVPPTTKQAIVVGQLIANPPGPPLASALQCAPPSDVVIMVSPPTAKHVVVLGQLIPVRAVVSRLVENGVGWRDHDVHASVVANTSDEVPTAKQTDVLGQLMESKGGKPLGDCFCQPVPPFAVLTTIP